MIIRILGDAIYDVPPADMPVVEQLDATLAQALEDDDDSTFSSALADLIGEIQHTGRVLEADEARTSELVVPFAGATIKDVRALLDDDASS